MQRHIVFRICIIEKLINVYISIGIKIYVCPLLVYIYAGSFLSAFCFYFFSISYNLMMNTKRNILIITLILSVLGIVMIYSSSYVWAEFKYGNAYKYVLQQAIFFIIGLFLLFFVSKIDYGFYKKYSNKFLFVCFILLVLVLIPGIGMVRNGSRSWFGIGGFGIQPSEISKIGLIIFVSKYLSN